MASFLKKKSDAVAPLAPAWHPNLRVVDRLPDTKVVRTAFFVNGVAIAVAASLLLYLVIQEWQIRSVNGQIAEWQRQIDLHKRKSDEAVALYGRFKTEAAKVAEVAGFAGTRPLFSFVLLRIGQTLPPKIGLDGVEMRDFGVTLRGTVRGSPDQASGDVSTFLDQLRRDAVLQPIFDDVQLSNLSRSAQSGRLTLEVFLQFRKGGPKK